jgi:hypothetical protein
MQYMLILYENESTAYQPGSKEFGTMMEEFGTFTQSIIDSGQFKGGEGLQGSEPATSVRVRKGKTELTDGPFAETREQLGGYYLIEAASQDEANAIAARLPIAKTGTVEVRPVMVYPG